MATIHIRPAAHVAAVGRFARSLGLTPAIQNWRVVLLTPREATAQTNAGRVKIPRRRGQLGRRWSEPAGVV